MSFKVYILLLSLPIFTAAPHTDNKQRVEAIGTMLQPWQFLVGISNPKAAFNYSEIRNSMELLPG